MIGLLDQLQTLVLVMNGEHLTVEFANQSAQKYLIPHHQVEQLTGLNFSELFPEVNLHRLLKRISQGRSSQFIKDYMIDTLMTPIQFQMRSLDSDRFILEGSNYSAVRETEHMLKSYSELIEKKNKNTKRNKDGLNGYSLILSLKNESHNSDSLVKLV